MRSLGLALYILLFTKTSFGQDLRHPTPDEKKYIAIVKAIPEIRKEINYYHNIIVFVDRKEGHTYYVNVSEDLATY